MSCKVNGTDTASIIREGQCLWAGASAVFLDTRHDDRSDRLHETAGLFTAGAQVALDNVWRLGFAGGYQTARCRRRPARRATVRSGKAALR